MTEIKTNFSSVLAIGLTLAFTVGVGRCAETIPSQAGRERISLDENWRFHLGDAPDARQQFDYPEPKNLAKTELAEVDLTDKLAANLPDPVVVNLGSAVSYVQTNFDDRDWRRLDLPHDWAVELPFSTNADLRHGFKALGKRFPENSVAWYRRDFVLPASDSGKSLWVEFDGVFRNSVVWLNGHCLGREPSGYSSFRYDLGQYANYGGTNLLTVRVDATRMEGWFYEGAGIYRHVWLVKTDPIHLAPDGIFVRAEFSNNIPQGCAQIHVQAALVNSQNATRRVVVKNQLLSPEGTSLAAVTRNVDLTASSTNETQSIICLLPPGVTNFSVPDQAVSVIHSPELWSPESPKLYRLVTSIEKDGRTIDQVETPFGIRTVAFDATNGFLLNGKRYVIQGTCNHQDHAGVGVALPDALQFFRVKKLKEMGDNALRTSHNPPTPELLQACDQLGMLVMDETRRTDTAAQSMDELKRLVLRDRNHPSVFIWSLGNEEIYLQGTNDAARDAAMRIGATMQELVHKLDPTRRCTVAMNKGWGEGFTRVMDVQGFNYGTRNIDQFRAKFPTQLAIGSETASTRTTRGVYADDKVRGYQSAYGENGVERAWGWWPYYATHPFTSGGFAWTGFDYRGEPTPYGWPCISSHFGIMDTCGFPKDIYYYYQAWWTTNPVLHLAPHWNWAGDEGKEIKVRAFANGEEVELFLNGQSLGRQPMTNNSYLDWKVNYAPGTLSAKSYAHGKLVAETKVETTGAAAAIQLTPDRSIIDADGKDLSIFTVAVTDQQGRVVPTAGNHITFTLSGPGKIIGVGNGDPSCHEPDTFLAAPAPIEWSRSVFNGLAQIIVQSTKAAGTIELTASADGLRPATESLKTRLGDPNVGQPKK